MAAVAPSQPADPGFAARTAAAFHAQGLMATIGGRLVAIEPGRCVIEADFHPGLTQHHGLFHAGVLTTLADNACGFAAMSLLPKGGEVLSVEFKVSFLRPAAGLVAVARGEVVKPGRTLSFCRADVVVRDAAGAETLVAAMTATMMAAAPEKR
ncbi:PaaI family thioesterase [Falsiroseomonas selenitidurans]|uniref:PaaI family thioesterase n=1 Tax=Falsiroseomonas selenitidurans TaxID=2716335 RepID=A0ABX1E3U8_9PROT|nr:PaaI family thioesterase [Falsiroseomonas selenitidurans]NKC30488.1 PaaI family thioesterase [Falsiroseomonas selenitidurans]